MSGRLPGGEHIFLTGDYYVQYMQFIKLFLRNLIQGNPLSYSFEVSMGMPTLAAYAYESLSPFNLWFLLVSDVDTAAFLVVLTKLALCGGAFCFFSESVLKTPAVYAVSLGCIYALCGYNVSFYYNVQYLDGVYLLPVLMLLLYRFVRTGRATALTLTYAYSFIVLFYSGYMLGVFSFVVWISLMWYEYGREKERYLSNIKSYLLCVISAILMSAVVTLPVLAFVLRHTSQDATAFQSIRVSLTELLAGMFPGQVQKVDGEAPALYSGMVALIAVPYFFFDKKQEKRRRGAAGIPLLFLVICTFVPPLYLMIHGFDATDLCHFRFAYMYNFLFLTITALVMRDFAAKQKQRSLWKRILPAVIAAELLLHGYFALAPDTEDLVRSTEYYRHWQQEGAQAVAQIREMETADPDAFYRVYYENAMEKNSAQFLDYHGISYFSSLEQPPLRNALYRLGYSTTPRAVTDYGSTPFTRMIFAQKYMVHVIQPLYESEGDFILQKNPCYLPIACMVTDQIAGVALDDENVFQNQNALAKAMTGLDVELYRDYSGPILSQSNGLHMEQRAEGYHLVSETGKGGSYSFILEPELGRLLYAYFSQEYSAEHFHTAKIGTSLDIGLPLSTSYLSVPHILPVAEDGEIRILIGEKDTQDTLFKNMYAAYLQEAALFAVYQDLTAGACSDLRFSDTEISFTITATENKDILFTSIPYDTGWTAMVDGAPAETIRVVEDAFLAVPLAPGTHRIELRYRDTAVLPGVIASVIGIVLLMVVHLYQKRSKSIPKQTKNH